MFILFSKTATCVAACHFCLYLTFLWCHGCRPSHTFFFQKLAIFASHVTFNFPRPEVIYQVFLTTKERSTRYDDAPPLGPGYVRHHTAWCPPSRARSDRDPGCPSGNANPPLVQYPQPQSL